MSLFQRARQELQAGNDRLRTLATTTSTVVWHADTNGAVSERNPSWEAFTGQTLVEYAGWGWLKAIHPDDRDAVAVAWQRGVEDREVVELNYRLRRHDGDYRQMQAQAAPVVRDGKISEWVGVCVDVSNNWHAEQALRRSEERLRVLDRLGQATRGLVDATDVMAVTARLLGETLLASRCAYADVEPDGDRFTIRQDWTRHGVPSSSGVYSLDLFGAQATSNLRAGRHLVVRDVDRELGDDGGGRMFNAIGVKAIICCGLVKGEKLVAMMAVHQTAPRDWTPQEISLVQEVVERCWAHIERVRDAAMLRDQDRRKDEFLATLAHELRNPLAPIKYAIAMLRRSRDPGQQAKAQDVIDRQVTQMARLIDDLLDLSRINRGLIELQRQPVALAPLVQQALEVARPAIDAARHQLEVQLPPDDLVIDADPTRIVQVIGNLLGNAAKYTPDGGHIRLAAWRAGHRMVLEVVDNGIGIPPDQQGRLFQMFTQLHHSTARAKGGLGIGLSLVRTLVHMHGGSVAVRSDGLDEGSTFTIELPLVEAVPRRVETNLDRLQSNHDEALRVLVVEDNDDGREMLVALLTALGYQVMSAADGPQALQQTEAFQPQVVLLDLGLPKMDGFEVCRLLRANPNLDQTFILALTGWGAERDRTRTTEAGFDAHLTKPVEPTALREALLRYAAAWPRVAASAQAK